MKVLVTGGSGLLGRAVCKELRAGGIDVTGTIFSRASEGLMRLDVSDQQAVFECVDDVNPDIIIHCAATRKPDICEGNPYQTRLLNVDATRSVTQAASKAGAWMVHISTDYIFDGTSAPYFPDSDPNPLNGYGVSKYESELAVQEVTGDYCILRVPILYGQVEDLEESPISVITGQIISGETLQFDDWAIRYPTSTGDVALVLKQILNHKIVNPDFGGICHWSGDEAFTKYGMAKVICDLLGISLDKISGLISPAGGASRPKDAHLDCGLLESLGIGHRTAFKDGVSKMIKPFTG